MNGAELPCGSILRVEPADQQYKQKKSEPNDATKCDEDVGHYGPAASATTDVEKASSHDHVMNESTDKDHGEGNNPDDDLDDFFDSL